MTERFERNPGRLVELRPGESRDVLDLRWRDEVGRVVCVTLVGPPAKAGPFGIVGSVQWGAGEAEAEAEIDYGVGGVVFTLPASSLRITAVYEHPTAGGTPSVRAARVGAFASVGSGDRASRLTRTRYHDAAIVPGGSLAFEVPPFAKALRVLGGDQATRSFRLDFIGTVTPQSSVEVLPGTPAPLIDLAPDVVSVLLTNTGAAALPAGTRARFQLGI